ncbi:hypothetical protein D3C73_1591150 [compost metagenome]
MGNACSKLADQLHLFGLLQHIPKGGILDDDFNKISDNPHGGSLNGCKLEGKPDMRRAVEDIRVKHPGISQRCRGQP